MNDELHFPVELSIRLDWSEMDLFGHINNVMFFKYIQASRVNYWDKIGFMSDFSTKKVGPLLVSNSCQFKKPLFFPGNITIQARVDFIKNSSMGIHHQILNDQKELAAEAQDIIVLYDFNTHKTVTIPEEWRKNISNLEKRSF
jgi:acyl-CoA thioester hydrolase